MSIKKYFDVKSEAQSLANMSAGEISSQVESVGYHEQDIIKEERYLPQVDLSKPENFARYGSAEEYYTQAIKRIYTTYPYDGSLKERLEWENESTYIDLHLFEDKYPRTNGYIIFSADGWGSSTGYPGGYGDPATEEYILVKGGPNNNPNGMAPYRQQFTGSNYYEPSMNRESNLSLNVNSHGISVEFWMKKREFIPTLTNKEVIFDIWNGVASSETNYGRLRLELSGASVGASAAPFLLTVYSGSTGFSQQALATATITSASVADDKWHHYAVTLKQGAATVNTKFYIDGQLNQSQEVSASGKGTLQDISGKNLRSTIGALVTSPRGLTAPAYAGKLSASLDEFRFWKTQRTSQQIGRYWFTQVGGGVNSDPEPFIETPLSSNVDLGVYYKFNEGITGNSITDSTVLDFSGRASNGAWTGYTSNSRNTGSAIVLSKAAIKEYKDPIIYPKHPKVQALLGGLQESGSAYDASNNAAIYNTMPAWIIEEDDEGTGDLRKLTQIMGSYFDTLHMQVRDLNRLKDVEYVSGSDKPFPFADRLLSSAGFVAPEIFVDADVLEKLADRSEKKVYEKSLSEIKDTIYKNIYNNLTYIYKSKGTEKAFRNLIRCFGIDDELVKLSLYANDVEYEMRNDRRNVTVADRFANFNTLTNQNAVIYNAKSSANANSVGFITSSATLKDGHAITMESEILFPLKPVPGEAGYITTNTISASLFGLHGAREGAHMDNVPTWAIEDNVNFQVYAVRNEIDSTSVRFVVTSSGDRAKVPYLTSELYEDVYNNSRWNLAVKIRPEKYPLTSLVDGAEKDPSRLTGSYTIELHGVEADAGEILNEFSVSKTISTKTSFMTQARRCYVGAHRTNFTGTVLQTSDVKVNACRFWLDNLPNSALNAHILDTENYGSLHPHYYAYPFQPSSSYGDVTKFDTLVFNWEFLQNTGSNAAGGFTVADLSSGSATSATNANTASFGTLGAILHPQYPGSGSHFAASSTTPIDKDFVVSSKLNLPENIYSADMVQVLGASDQELFGATARPVNYFFAFEKSMYQVISEEIINYFANLRDFNNLIGNPVNKWRPEYKDLAFMRQKFFEKDEVEELDFDKFYEFYKWFDTSLSAMLQQLVPASADVAEDVRTVIENHILERPKYQRKFPFLDNVGQSDISGSIAGEMTIAETAQGSPDEFPQGSAFFTNTAFTKRQIGSSNPPDGRPWAKFHAPVAYPRSNSENNSQVYWERYLAKRTESSRQAIFDAVESTFERRSKSPVKFGVEGTTAVGGVSKHHNSIVNYVFEAARAWGGKVAGSSNQAQKILVSSGSTVEELIKTPEEFYPTFKQRLGFTLSGSGDAVSGPRHAPFSLYSSSVTEGYNAQVVANYASGVMVTNLHNDFVIDTDVPMQGPFTQEYVGGRFYRHTRINQKGTDSNTTRGEGFRIDFDNRGSEDVKGVNKKSLVILPPNAPHGVIDTSLPTAYRFRDVTAKRPVNIKNIQMRTGSTIIGNYEKNYQVVNSNSRMKNDPFFNDQSFNFALYPETLATRGRFPLVVETSTDTSTRDQTDYIFLKGKPGVDGVGYITSGSNSADDDLGSHPQKTISLWFSASKNTVQQAGPPWQATGYGGLGFPAQYNGEERTLFAWGGCYNQDITRRVFLKSGSNASPSDGSKGPRLGISFMRGTTINGYYWISEDDIFTSPGWYHVVFSADQLNWKREDFLGSYSKANRQSLSFNSSNNSYINLINGATTAATWQTKMSSEDGASPQDWSISFWLRPPRETANATGGANVISLEDSSGNLVHGIGYVDDSRSITYLSDNMSASAGVGSQAAARGVEGWQHYTVTYAVSGATDSQVKMYRNGVFVSKFCASDGVGGKNNYTIDGACRIGQAPAGGTYLTGALCDFAIWDRVLTLPEIRGVSGWRAGSYEGPLRSDLNALVPTDGGEFVGAPSAGNLISFWPMTFGTEGGNSSVTDLQSARPSANGLLYNKARCRALAKNELALSCSNFETADMTREQGPAFMSSSTGDLNGFGTHQRYLAYRGPNGRKGSTIYVNGISAATSSAFQSGSQHGTARTGSNQSIGGESAAMTAFAPIYGGVVATDNGGAPFGAAGVGIGQIAVWRNVYTPSPHAPVGAAHATSSAWVNNFMTVRTTSSYQGVAVAPCTLGASSGTPSGGRNRGWTDLTSSTPHAGFNYSLNIKNWWKFGPNVNIDRVQDRGPETRDFRGAWSTAAISESAGENFAIVPFSASELAAYGGGAWTKTTTGETANCGGNLNFLVPERTGSDSQETIIVNRYAGSGYEVMSLGYMDPAHTEMSVYNAAPYHNLAIIDHGLSGNVPADPIAAQTITVVDQIGKNRGLDQRASLRCGKFGADAAFGPGVQPSSSYPALPSWHKTNSNRKRFMFSSATKGQYYTASVYDNLFVQHQIPRSEQQYAWVTASLQRGKLPAQNRMILGLNAPASVTASTWPLATEADYSVGTRGYPYGVAPFPLRPRTGPVKPAFVGANLIGPPVASPVNLATHTLERSLGAFDSESLYMSGTAGSDASNYARVDIGPDSEWNTLIGGSGTSAKAMSVATWIMAPTGSPGAYFPRVFDFGSDRNVIASDYGGNRYKLQWQVNGATAGKVVGPPLSYGHWYHVVVTFKGGDPAASGTGAYMKVYVNGIKSGSVTQELDDPAAIGGDSYIGDSGAGSRNWVGNMNEFQIYDIELTPRNVHALYNYGAPAEPYRLKSNDSTFPSDNLVAWYRMGDAPGDSLSAGGNIHNAAVNHTLYKGGQYDAHLETNGTGVIRATSSVPPASMNYSFNSMILHRQGPYGWPTWKQIRAGESPVARKLRSKNLIGQIVPPSPVPNIINNVQVGSVPALKANTFVDYYESPVSSKYGPVQFYFEDNTTDSNPDNNVTLRTTYGNDLEYFTNDGLNNRLGLEIDLDKPMAFDTVRNYLVDSDLSTVVTYTESMYPSARNMYSDKVRTRTKYDINNIWNPNRAKRSFPLGGRLNVMGQTIGTASVWPADAHLNYTTTSSVRPTDGAGILMNSYSRYSASYMPYNGSSAETAVGLQLPAPTYSWRLPTGLTGSGVSFSGTDEVYTVLAGDTPWTAPTESGKDPYENYSTWAENLRVVGKNYSLVPEFRISEKLETYYNAYSGDFLTNKLNDIYELTGTVLANSSHPDFFRTYTNTDFMKYFGAIDEDLNDTRSGDLKISRDRIKLKASGLIKFLPYKGFYPAERTLQLAQKLSQSYGGAIQKGAYIAETGKGSPTYSQQYYRIFLEPLMSPGILYNTIKSGIAVHSCVLVNTCSVRTMSPYNTTASMNLSGIDMTSTFPEGKVYYKRLINLGTGSADSRGYHIAKVPFETVQDPSAYFNVDQLLNVSKANTKQGGKRVITSGLSSRKVPQAAIYDTASPSAPDALPQSSRGQGGSGISAGHTGGDLPRLAFNTGPYLNQRYRTPQPIITLTDPAGGYRYAMDNFLCETTEFFLSGLASLRSNREDQFGTVVSGAVYTSTVRLYRSSRTATDDSRWDMYSRVTGFGFPLATQVLRDVGSPNAIAPTFSHVTPPYFAGEGTATLIYTASYSGKPTLDEIFSKMKISYNREELVPNYSASIAVPTPGITSTDPGGNGGRLNDARMQLDSSLNLKMKVSEVPLNTNTQQNFWLIQSKFETPILNFANVTASQPPAAIPATLEGNQYNANELSIHGMWHQYGALVTGSAAGVFVEISDQSDANQSLADIVGFPKGAPLRIGEVKPEAKLEEAIVAIPYKITKNRREFFKINARMQDTAMYRKLLASMNKYVFPPKFDFTRHDTVDPVLTYIFEFSADITQQDIADMWQNLPPDIEERITEQEVIVEDRELLSLMASTTDKIEWMVFKVKKRAKRDFDKYKRSLVTADTSALAPKLEGPYTYNWPYDYFSLVELANIEATAQWTSKDMQYEISENDAGDLDGRPPTAGRVEIASNPNASNRQAQPQPNRQMRAQTPTVEEVRTRPRVSQATATRRGRRRSSRLLRRDPTKTRGGKS